MASGFKVGSLVILSIALCAGSLLLGEIVLVVAYVVTPIAVITRWPNQKALGWTAVLVFGAALVLHFFGFKLLGSATVVELESLRHPRRVAALEPPNTIRFADGSTASVAHIFFPRVVEVTNPTSGYYESFRGYQDLRVLMDPEKQSPIGIQVEMTKTTNDSSGAVCLRKQSYWCGNTWTPQFFPARLPRRVRTDLAPILISAGLALPSPERVARSSIRYDALIGALENAVTPDLPQNHSEIERLALALIDAQHWDKGLELLIETGASDKVAIIRASIKNELDPLRVEEAARQGASNGWAALLLKVDLHAAYQAIVQLLSTNEFDIERASGLAGSMVGFGDIRGFDLLIGRLDQPDLKSEWSRRLTSFTRGWFRFDIYLNGGGCPDDITPEFVDWYREVRPRLSYKRLPAGRQGFALGDGMPFDLAYYESMKPFKDRIAQRHEKPIHRYRFFD